MKQIIIVLLVLILGIMGYNLYKKHQRFNPPNYEYQIPEKIASMNTDSELLYDYYQAVEELNAYVITQWSDDRVDVRNPGDDDEEFVAAANRYAKKLGKVRFYEAQLVNSKKEVEPGLLSEEDRKKQLVLKMFYMDPDRNAMRIGDRGALVYEIQSLLISHGDSIKHDGLFNTETFNALKAFEAKNGLMADGKLDALTLDYLLR